MNKSETIGAFAKAMAKAQTELENASKNAQNPHFRSKYADLGEILNTVRPVLAKNGLSVIQSPSVDGSVASVETMIIHESGEFISGVISCPLQKQDAQGVGSATTYLRRYALAAFAGVAQEDDDGNTASTKHAQEQTKSKPDEPTPLPICTPEKFEQMCVDVVNEHGEVEQMGWKSLVQSGQKTADHLIKALSTKYRFTSAQLNTIKSWAAQ